jgi:hypothetical protein
MAAHNVTHENVVRTGCPGAGRQCNGKHAMLIGINNIGLCGLDKQRPTFFIAENNVSVRAEPLST